MSSRPIEQAVGPPWIHTTYGGRSPAGPVTAGFAGS